MLKSRTIRKACLRMSVVFFLFAISVVTSFVPGFDLAKGAVLGVVMSSLYLYQALARTREEETDRYKRVAEELFPVRLGEDPAHLSNILLSGDIPYQWLTWIGELLKIDVKKEAGGMLHSLDSFCSFGDSLAQGVVRATAFVSAVIAQERNLQEALKEFVAQNNKSLGSEFQKGCFICELQKGSVLPYGIFQATGSARLLVTFYAAKRAVKQLDIFGREVIKIKTVNSMRICVKSTLSRDETKSIVNALFPETDPKNFGSGPQQYGLFIQETVSVDRQSIEKRLPELIKQLGL